MTNLTCTLSRCSSEDQVIYLRRRKKVPGEASKGFSTSASNDQSRVLQILTDLSSEAVARNSPTGSQHTPFTKPRCKSSALSRSNEISLDLGVSLCTMQDLPKVKPHHISTLESSPTEARYRSPGAQARSVTSGKITLHHIAR